MLKALAGQDTAQGAWRLCALFHEALHWPQLSANTRQWWATGKAAVALQTQVHLPSKLREVSIAATCPTRRMASPVYHLYLWEALGQGQTEEDGWHGGTEWSNPQGNESAQILYICSHQRQRCQFVPCQIDGEFRELRLHCTFVVPAGRRFRQLLDDGMVVLLPH